MECMQCNDKIIECDPLELKCRHVFHPYCVGRYVLQGPSSREPGVPKHCPVCRADIGRRDLERISRRRVVHPYREFRAMGGDRNVCSLCQRKAKQKVCAIPCRHPYHKECFERWLDEGDGDCAACLEPPPNLETESDGKKESTTKVGLLDSTARGANS